MSELTKQFSYLQSASHNEFASPDGSRQKYLADSIRNFGKAFGESTVLDRQYELAEKKAREDAEKKRKAEEEIRNNSNALRLFKAKGGAKLPEKETSWSPAAGNIENLEYANDGLRKEYNILFAESKIKEENSLTSASSKDLTGFNSSKCVKSADITSNLAAAILSNLASFLSFSTFFST